VRILVDISHPAHVHFFRNAISVWQEHGHAVRVVGRDKDLACLLLKRYNIPSTILSKAPTGILGLMMEMLVHIGRLLPIARAFKPHVMLQIGGTFVGPVGWLARIPAWAFTDTENAALSNSITFPMVNRIFTPECYGLNHGPKHTRYPGFHELAYLHPRRFQPDPSVLAASGLKASDPFFIVRLVGWQSAHDIGQKGLSPSDTKQLISELAGHGRVFVSSECPVADRIKAYTGSIPVHQIHHFMAFATLVVGESATMTSEAAVLGTPAIFVSNTGRGYTDVQESRYGLVLNFRKAAPATILPAIRKLLTASYGKNHWEKKRQHLLKDTVDVTGWLVRLVECFGETRNADFATQEAFAAVREEGD
jgi:hypothetical protein